MKTKIKESSWKERFYSKYKDSSLFICFDGCYEGLVDFIQSEIDQALKSQLEQVQGMIVKLIVTNYDEDFDTYDYKAIACGVLKLKLKK